MTPPTEFATLAPPFRRDEAGGIRIGQSRVTLDSLLAAHQNGASPTEIAQQYPVLDLAEIYGAIAYYLTHHQEINTYLETRQHQAQQHRQQLAKNHDLNGLRDRLLVRRQAQQN